MNLRRRRMTTRSLKGKEEKGKEEEEGTVLVLPTIPTNHKHVRRTERKRERERKLML